MCATGEQATGPSGFNVYADVAAEVTAPAEEAAEEAAKAVGESLCCRVCMDCAYSAPCVSTMALAV